MKVCKSIVRKSISLAACLAVLCAAGTSAAQEYPSRSVRLVVPYPPGGGADTLARVVGTRLAKHWGHPVVVENRVGAGGNIAFTSIVNSDPDGYTLLLTPNGIATNASLLKNPPYDPIRDFAPITMLATVPMFLVVNASIPVNTVGELLAFIKAKPGQTTFGSAGNGTSLHLASELLKMQTGVDMTHVPYKGAAPAVVDLLAGRITMVFSTVTPVLAHLKSGKLRALGVTTPRRSTLFPDLPTVAEAGVAGYELVGWFGLFSRAGTPKAIIDKVYQDTVAVLKDPEVRGRMAQEGMEVAGTTPEQSSSMLRKTIVDEAKLVKASGIPIE